MATGAMNKTYSYDGNCDLTSVTGTSRTTSINLNAQGQINSITPPGSSPISMSYTGTGESQRVGAGSTQYQHDAAGLSKQTDSTGSTYFTSLPDGTLISQTNPSGTYYYLSDGQGSTAALTDSSGTLQNQYAYDPLGNITSSTGSVANPITYQGGMYDSRTGFYYTGGGYYDSQTGQDFGCKDNGKQDPGEDSCGEDEGIEHIRRIPAGDISHGNLRHPHQYDGYLLINVTFKGNGTILVTVTAVGGPGHRVVALVGNITVGLAGQGSVKCFPKNLKQAPSSAVGSTLSESCSVHLSGTGRAYIESQLYATYCGAYGPESVALVPTGGDRCVDYYGGGFQVPI